MIEFTQRLTTGTQITCIREHGDRTGIRRVFTNDVPAETVWSHTYSEEGEYTMSLHCYNYGDSFLLKRSIRVLPVNFLTLVNISINASYPSAIDEELF